MPSVVVDCYIWIFSHFLLSNFSWTLWASINKFSFASVALVVFLSKKYPILFYSSKANAPLHCAVLASEWQDWLSPAGGRVSTEVPRCKMTVWAQDLPASFCAQGQDLLVKSWVCFYTTNVWHKQNASNCLLPKMLFSRCELPHPAGCDTTVSENQEWRRGRRTSLLWDCCHPPLKLRHKTTSISAPICGESSWHNWVTSMCSE